MVLVIEKSITFLVMRVNDRKSFLEMSMGSIIKKIRKNWGKV